MKHMETRLCSPESPSGHFFSPPSGPLTLPSPQWNA